MNKILILSKVVALVCLMNLISVNHADSGPYPYKYWMDNPDSFRSYYCSDEKYLRFKRGNQIATVHLSIKDFIYNSGDAKNLSIDFDKYDKKSESNNGIYESFLASVKNHNSGKEVALFIANENEEVLKKCAAENSGKEGFSWIDKCRAKQASYIGAKYGNALLQFYCHLQVKGTRYPILLRSRCSINASEKLEYSKLNELTDINAFEESTIKEGVKRLLDEHVKNLSKVFEVIKLCK